jgi:hypothetical protein
MPRSSDVLRQELNRLQKNDEVLRLEVAKFGVDLGKPRIVDLTFWAPDEPSAARLRDALMRNEAADVIMLGPGREEANQRWLVRGSICSSVDTITQKENVAVFLLLADENDCEYDGWGTAIVEAATRSDVNN